MNTGRSASDAHKERIIAAAAKLLAEGGREAVSTRVVSEAAGVQAPTIYRLFGDKQGLLDAVMTHGLTTYVTSKSKADQKPTADPINELRAGWDQHVDFGLANPALYALIYSELRPGAPPPAAVAGAEVLAKKIRRVAEAGRLRVDEERAAQLFHAAGSGITLTLIAMPEDRRDLSLSDLAREAAIASITTDVPATATPGPVGAAVALRAVLSQTTALTTNERFLLQEWLERIARG